MANEREGRIGNSNVLAAMGGVKEMQARFTDPSLSKVLRSINLRQIDHNSWSVGVTLGAKLTVDQMKSLSEDIGAPVKFNGPDGFNFPPDIGPKKTLIFADFSQIPY